jgi:adenylate cyclase
MVTHIGRKEKHVTAKQEVDLKNRVIVFIDIHNYSIAASTLRDEPWHFLQETYETLGEIIVAHGGEIIKYLGDGIMCVFAGSAETDAVRCALILRSAFSDLVARHALPPETELEIGISSGRVAIGTFGHRSLRQKDVFGSDVMLAAVIGHHRGVAITKAVYERVKTDYETRELPERTVKWQAEPLRVWEVIA